MKLPIPLAGLLVVLALGQAWEPVLAQGGASHRPPPPPQDPPPGGRRPEPPPDSPPDGRRGRRPEPIPDPPPEPPPGPPGAPPRPGPTSPPAPPRPGDASPPPRNPPPGPGAFPPPPPFVGGPGPGSDAPGGIGFPGSIGPSTGLFDDLAHEDWTLWWHYNQAPYLDLKRHLYARATVSGSDDFFLGHGERDLVHDSLRPSAAVVHERVVPALLAALRRERNPEILSAALVALGKIGEVAGAEQGALAKAIRPFLARGNQEVAESAALALGILGSDASVAVLLDLVHDSERGQELVRSSRVPERTRAFAAIGLGLVGHRTRDEQLRRVIAAHLTELLEGPNDALPDVKIAAISALGIVPIEVRPDAPRPGPGGDARWGDSDASTLHVISRRTQIAYVLGWLDPREVRRGKRQWQVQAHAPTALARLLDGAPDGLKEPVVRALLARLEYHAEGPVELQQSCALALGAVADADGDELDAEIRERLAAAIGFADARTRRFALIALAQAGGRAGAGGDPLAGTPGCTELLLRTLARGDAGLRPWAALGAGVLARSLREGADAGDPAGVSASLLAATRDARRPNEIGAYALGLGLLRDPRGGPLLVDKLRDFSADDVLGHLSIGLGLLRERTAIAPITELVRDSEYRPELLARVAVGLGLLGDKDVVGELLEMLRGARSTASQASCARALGIVGDVRSLDGLLAMLEDTELTETARAFAAVALGAVCDKEDLPWSAKLTTGVNYLALPPTLAGEGLAGEGRGILEIL